MQYNTLAALAVVRKTYDGFFGTPERWLSFISRATAASDGMMQSHGIRYDAVTQYQVDNTKVEKTITMQAYIY